MAAFVVILTVVAYAELVHSILPIQCNANFRWDDCGGPPRPVIYYWRTGSRCEVGIWRGCLPNMNMFKDEYECVSTCVFTIRAQDQNFHQLNKEDGDDTENIPNDKSSDENDGRVLTTPCAKTQPGDPGKIVTNQTAAEQNTGVNTGGPVKTIDINNNPAGVAKSPSTNSTTAARSSSGGNDFADPENTNITTPIISTPDDA